MIVIGSILVAFAVILVVYTYLLYPAILRVLPRHAKAVGDATPLPSVSIVIPAYNEEAQIRGAIEALLAQDYPSELRQVLILSDASTDRTDAIVSEYASRGVELLRMPARGGKTAAENASCALLKGGIIINSDASIRLHPLAVRRLAEAMSDPRVGVASTRDVSVTRETGNTTEAGYVGYEMRIRALETLTGGIVGASGSGYAIRQDLHRLPVRAELSRDFSAALTARMHDYIAVSVDDAICYVPRTTSLKAEYRRKVRTIARGMETLLHNSDLLDITRYGLFAWKLISHKVCRWVVPPAAVLGALGLALLAPSQPIAGIVLAVGLAGCLVASCGALWPASRPMPRLLSVVTFAAAANLAVIHAVFRVLHGHEDHVWEPTRRGPTHSAGLNA